MPCYIQYSSSASFGASLRNECPVGSGHSASPAAERGPCCCLAVFTWAKQMVVSSYLRSYTPPIQKAPFFSWKRLAKDYGGGRCVTLMTSVALQLTVRQKLVLKIWIMCLESVRCFPGVLWSDPQNTDISNNKIQNKYINSLIAFLAQSAADGKLFKLRQTSTLHSSRSGGWS